MWYQANGDLRIDGLCYNFLPSWWHRGYGVAFGERWVFDPDYRTETLRFMERTVHERFPGLGIGSPDPRPAVTMPDFGNAVTPALAGCRVEYPVDNYPWSHHLESDRVAGLRVPAPLADAWPYSEIVRQARYLSATLGRATPPRLPPRGVQNDAVLIRGIEFFEDAVIDPPAGRRLLAYSAEVLAATIEANAGFGSLDDVVQPLELPLHDLARARGMRFGIHHCGVIDPYLPLYRKFPRLDFLEIGWGSDPTATLAAFPEATIQYIVLPSFVMSSSEADVRARITELLDAARGGLHRFRFSVPDLEHGTPEENLEAIRRACARER
jgi:hypothetical protein